MKTILVVEDDVRMADHIAKSIGETDRYDAVVAHNGKEAFEVLDRHKRFLGLANNQIKCIVLDLKMPEMDGVQFITEFRQKEPFFKLMPVIILTAYEDKEKWQATTGAQWGAAAAYLKKPFDRKELLDAIDRVFKGEMGYMIDETREKSYERLKKIEEEERFYGKGKRDTE